MKAAGVLQMRTILMKSISPFYVLELRIYGMHPTARYIKKTLQRPAASNESFVHPLRSQGETAIFLTLEAQEPLHAQPRLEQLQLSLYPYKAQPRDKQPQRVARP